MVVFTLHSYYLKKIKALFNLLKLDEETFNS